MRLTPGKSCIIRDRLTFSEDKQTNDICIKCMQLEDIEDDIQIDLRIVHVALTDGFWYKTRDNIIARTGQSFRAIRRCGFGWLIETNVDRMRMQFKLKDYGKTWALTKEELEQ